MVPAWIFLGVVRSFVPHDILCGPQAALIAECFKPRLRYSGCSIGYQLASLTADGPARLIATALVAATGSGYAIAVTSWSITRMRSDCTALSILAL